MAAQLLATSMPCIRQGSPQPSWLLNTRQKTSISPYRLCMQSVRAGTAHRSSRALVVRAIDADDIIAEAMGEGDEPIYRHKLIANATPAARWPSPLHLEPVYTYHRRLVLTNLSLS